MFNTERRKFFKPEREFKILFCFVSVLMLSFTAYGSAFQKTAKWDHSEIKVCWATAKQMKRNKNLFANPDGTINPPLVSDLVKKEIEQKINSEFTAQTTGIHFVGWENCTLTEAFNPTSNPEHTDRRIDADVAILLEDGSGEPGIDSYSNIGFTDMNITDGEFHRVAPNSNIVRTVHFSIPSEILGNLDQLVTGLRLSWRQQLQFYITHEFGHLAGLLHEHLAYINDIKHDPHCHFVTIPSNFTANENEDLYVANSERNFYDSNSIMNYCQRFQIDKLGVDFFALPIEPFTVTDPLLNAEGKKTYDHLYFAITNGKIDPLSYPGASRLSDPTIFSITPAPTTDSPDRVHVTVNLSLSTADKKVLYEFYHQL